MRKEVHIKNRGVVTIYKENVEELVKEVKCSESLCKVCKNARATLCPKIYDDTKKNISEYDFITDGAQVFVKNGELRNFAVTGCKGYEQDRLVHKPTTKEELLKRQRDIESLFIYSYDGVDMEEARKNREDIMRRLNGIRK